MASIAPPTVRRLPIWGFILLAIGYLAATPCPSGPGTGRHSPDRRAQRWPASGRQPTEISVWPNGCRPWRSPSGCCHGDGSGSASGSGAPSDI